MAFSNYLMKGRRSLRHTGRYRYRQNQENDEDTVQIDFTKDINLITYDILKNVCQKQDISEEKYLAYLNAFVKLLVQYDKDYFSKISYSVEDIFICVRITLLNDSSLVRAAGLRALRYMIKTEQHVVIMNKLQYPALIARSLDLILVRNDSERVQALRLTRTILIVAPHLFHTAIARSLMCVALASKTPAEIEEDKHRRDRKEDEEEEKCNDRMARAFIAVITELCILNQDIFLDCGGVRTLMHSLAVVRPGRMTESILGALLHLVNLPQSRERACVDFQFIAGSFTELPCVEHKTPWAYASEARAWYHVALLSLLRSWPGLLHFCHPHDSLTLKSLVDTLYLNNLNVRKAVLEVLHELIGLPQPEWTDEFSVILEAVDPARFQDDFKLSEGFIVKEAKSVLPHISKCRVDISELHLSLVLYCLLEADILNTLIYVIISEDTLISVSATILLGQIMYLAHKQLPPECVNLTPAVPNLVSYAVRGRPALVISGPPSPPTPGPLLSATDMSRAPTFDQSTMSNTSKNQVVQSMMEILSTYSSQESVRNDIDTVLNSHHVEADFCLRSQQRALSAVTALSELHKMFRKRPSPASVFLDLIISHVNLPNQQEYNCIGELKARNLPKHKIPQILSKESEEAIKDSGVLTVKDPFAWNWEAIRAVFKTRAQPLVRLEETSHKLFLKKIVNFLLPSNNQLSRCDLSSNIFSLATIDLLKFLLDCEHAEASRLLEEFLADLHDQMEAIITSESAHDVLLSPKNVTNTLCQHYFLFIGVLSTKPKGLKFLETNLVLDVMNRVALQSKHDCYVKLIVSCLDYSSSLSTRLILSNILTCDQVSSRLYATQFLSILLRASLDSKAGYSAWVVESLVNQLQDEKKQVALCALSSLDEACDNEYYLELVIALRPSLLYFGDKGLLLLIRFLSSPSGFSYLSEANFVSNQLEKWATHFNYRYVQLMEADIHDCLTLHRRTEDGHYTRRLSNTRCPIGSAYVLPHLYAMLARHEPGYLVLRQHQHLYSLFQNIINGLCSTEEEILELKASLWAVGNFASCPAGLGLLVEQGVLQPITQLVEHCPVYSVRATSFYTLSLIATTQPGVAQLQTLGWMSVRKNRHELWPPLPPPPIELIPSSCPNEGERGATSEESSESTDHVTPLFFMGDSDTQLPWFRHKERASSLCETRRSATLPHKSAVTPFPQHFRSFSESKAEAGSDSWENQSHVTDELCKKSRSDSCCTDSSTSGVSSCDSSHVPRYHAIGEKVHQTLSPIPSTGSIATMKSVHPSAGSTSKHRNSFSLRAKHSLGHSTFLSLRSLRPHPSPSVSLDLINFTEGTKMSPLIRPKLSAKYMHQPVASEFEVTGLPDLLLNEAESPTLSQLSGSYPSSRSCIVGPHGQPMMSDNALWNGPCYQGICLPLHLPQMFPPLDTLYPQQTSRRHDQEFHVEGTSELDGGESENELEENKKSNLKHDRSSCLLCVVKYAPNRTQILRNRKISSSSIHRTRSETESSYGGGVGGEGESPVLVPWPQQKTPGLSEITPASGESLASHNDNTTAFGFAKALMDSSNQSRSSVRKELLRLVEQMANPILFRTCKQGLLTIKQSCKDLFQDVCVYSDVCNILAQCNHRLQARRFLQDLFVDSTFIELQEEPKSILTVSPPDIEEPTSSSHVDSSQPSDGDLSMAVTSPGGGGELAVILEGRVEEVWCPERQSDAILETLSSIYTSDSIDELTDENLFMKPCSSRLVLSQLQDSASSTAQDAYTLLNKALDSSSLHNKALDSSSLHNKALDSSSLHDKALDISSPHDKVLDSSSLHDKVLDSSSIHNKALDSSSLHEKVLDSSSLHDKVLDSSSLHDKVLDSSSLHDKVLDRSYCSSNQNLRLAGNTSKDLVDSSKDLDDNCHSNSNQNLTSVSMSNNLSQNNSKTSDDSNRSLDTCPSIYPPSCPNLSLPNTLNQSGSSVPITLNQSDSTLPITLVQSDPSLPSLISLAQRVVSNIPNCVEASVSSLSSVNSNVKSVIVNNISRNVRPDVCNVSQGVQGESNRISDFCKVVASNQHTIVSSSESNDENFDRNRMNRVSVEVVIEQIPRECLQGESLVEKDLVKHEEMKLKENVESVGTNINRTPESCTDEIKTQSSLETSTAPKSCADEIKTQSSIETSTAPESCTDEIKTQSSIETSTAPESCTDEIKTQSSIETSTAPESCTDEIKTQSSIETSTAPESCTDEIKTQSSIETSTALISKTYTSCSAGKSPFLTEKPTTRQDIETKANTPKSDDSNQNNKSKNSLSCTKDGDLDVKGNGKSSKLPLMNKPTSRADSKSKFGKNTEPVPSQGVTTGESHVPCEEIKHSLQSSSKSDEVNVTEGSRKKSKITKTAPSKVQDKTATSTCRKKIDCDKTCPQPNESRKAKNLGVRKSLPETGSGNSVELTTRKSLPLPKPLVIKSNGIDDCRLSKASSAIPIVGRKISVYKPPISGVID